MAITNAQQYKQLLAKGGRIGLKGGADASTESFSKSFDKQHGTNTASKATKDNSVNVNETATGLRDIKWLLNKSRALSKDDEMKSQTDTNKNKENVESTEEE